MDSQAWNAAQYAENGRFVADLAGDLLSLLAPKPGEHILDLGCGDGILTQKIAASGAHVTGIDASASMLATARARGLDARLMSAEALNFEEEFDAVFSNAALHWMRDQDAVLRGVRRALKPGGRFAAEMGGHGNIAAIRVALLAVLRRWGLESLELDCNYFPTPESYAARLQRHRFHVRSMEIFPRPTLLPASGMRGWLKTFRQSLFDSIPAGQWEEAMDECVRLLTPVLRDDDGNWTAHYVRLRFLAIAA
jgi:trans-aconitate methyltransferase